MTWACDKPEDLGYVGIDMDGMRAAWSRIRLDRIGDPVLVLADGFPGHVLTATRLQL